MHRSEKEAPFHDSHSAPRDRAASSACGELIDLCRVIYPARVAAYILAALMLSQLDDGNWLLAVGIACILLYPYCLQRFLERNGAPRQWTRHAMLLDALLVGFMISLVGFNLEATAVLTSLLLISVLIVGGFRLLLVIVPVFAVSSWIGWYFMPMGYSGGDTFYLMCLLAIVGYVVFVGALVFRETRRLHSEHRETMSVQLSLESFRRSMTPFLPFAAMGRNVDLVPKRKRLTVLFADLEGFTDLMDSGDETWVASLLNSYFATVTQLTHCYGGTVDKFIGDGAMVYFGDPDSAGAGEDAVACVSMALALQQRFARMALVWQRENPRQKRLLMRIGIHTGYCLVGQFGSHARKDYTALGSTVNRASRLEGQAMGGEILMSAVTHRLTQGRFHSSLRGEVSLKGVSEPMTIYRVDSLVALPEAARVSLLG